MEDLERMAIFARVVEDKSFSAAARRLGLSKSLVSKQISQLERSVGARLLNRTTRALSLTEAGAVFYEHCSRIVEELEEARLAVARLHSEPRGLLRISAPVAFGRLHIATALPEFLAAHPDDSVAFLHVDCDIYSSTVTVLRTLAPRLKPGAILVFDEYFNYPNWQRHEWRAFQEFIRDTGMSYRYLGFAQKNGHVAVRLGEEFGEQRGQQHRHTIPRIAQQGRERHGAGAWTAPRRGC